MKYGVDQLTALILIATSRSGYGGLAQVLGRGTALFRGRGTRSPPRTGFNHYRPILLINLRYFRLEIVD